MFGVHYLENGWSWRLCSKWSPMGIGNGLWRIEWSLARWRHVSGLFIRNWLYIVTPLSESKILLGIIEKQQYTSVYHTVNGNRALFHIENSKNDKGYITNQHVDILTRCSKYNLDHFCCFRCVKQCTIAVNSVINWIFFYYICCFSIIPSKFYRLWKWSNNK